MPGNKITLSCFLFFFSNASKYCHFSILLLGTIRFSSQTLNAILLNTKQ